MGHTNTTVNLSLPQFIGTDKPTWLGDVNGAFAAIDAYAGTNDAAVSAAAAAAANAVADASAAVNTANNANTTAGNASSTATAANTVAGQALTVANSTDAKVGALVDLNTTDKTSIVNAINSIIPSLQLVKASSNAGTYADKLAEITADYQALSVENKLKSIFMINNNTILTMEDLTNGVFTCTTVESSDFKCTQVDLVNHTLKEYGNGTVTDQSSVVNASVTFELYLV